MKQIFKSLPIAISMITRDPVNLTLALIPSLLALMIYLISVVAIFRHSEAVIGIVARYVNTPETAGLIGKVLTGILIVFVFIIMSWTFILLVGIISAPFNSMLSSRIERKLAGEKLEGKGQKTFQQIVVSLGETFKNEFKKLFLIILLSMLALLLNLFPLFYPLGIFLVSLVMAIQFVDYSWSRHDWSFGACLKDTAKNLLSYGGSGFFFVLLITIPIINTMVPALATSYFTVLWIKQQQQKKIPQAT
jgi:CysZ protein